MFAIFNTNFSVFNIQSVVKILGRTVLRLLSLANISIRTQLRRERIMQFPNFSRLLGLAALLALTPALFAQTGTTGDLAGAVTDSTGAVVPAAIVVLKSPETGETRTSTTSDTGAYRFTFLKPGASEASASAA